MSARKGRSNKDASDRGAFDARLLEVLETLPVVTVEDLCRVLFPGLSWEDCQKAKRWAEFQGALGCTAWIVHWRCRILARRRVIQQVCSLETDQFYWSSPQVVREGLPKKMKTSAPRVAGLPMSPRKEAP